MKIRVATPEDAGALVEIYRPYVENTSITFEYEVPSVSEFETRIRTTFKKIPLPCGRGKWRSSGICLCFRL